jgi:hypothetical protein
MHWVLLCSISHALTAPVGWTVLPSGKVLREKGYPSSGELIEISAESSDVHSLAFGMLERGYSPQRSKKDPYGRVWFALPEGKGCALWLEAESRWIVLMFSEEVEPSLDIEGILSQASAKADAPGSSSGAEAWKPVSRMGDWGYDEAIGGRTWSSSSYIRGLSTHIVLDLSQDGKLRMERSVDGRKETVDGTWMTANGSLRLQLGSELIFTNYQQVGSTLSFELERAILTFYSK